MKKTFWIFGLFTLFLAGCIGCTTPEQEAQEKAGQSSLTLMTWNIHNLFNGVDDGFEYDEFLTSSGWSEEKYLGRVNTITAAIQELHKKPDIILFQELESLGILEDIALSLNYGYKWSHFAANYGASLGLGIISRLPLGENGNSNRVHSITIGNETAPRPVLEVRVEDEDDPFVIFICHWKSKLGGDDETELLRRACAKIILRRIRELHKNEPELGVIIAGDLNMNHDDFYRRGSNTVTALIPDDPHSVQLAGKQNDFLILSGKKPPDAVYFTGDSVVLFSPWMDGIENGSYYYAYSWETIDHFILSRQFFNDSRWEYEKMEVIDYQPFTNANGYPVGYNVKTGYGLSDHLPLLLTLKKISE